jgi:hypothetical protein
MKQPSLAGMVDTVDATLSREALHQRFSETAVAFMRACFEFALRQVNEGAGLRTPLLRFFRRVLVFDSTSWDVDPALHDTLPGSGGGASSANCKVQVCLEYLSGLMSFAQTTAGTCPDNRFSAQLPTLLAPGDLLVADLGYFCLETFCRVVAMGAFFLSRLLVGTALFDERTGKRIDLCELLSATRADTYHTMVLMGAEPQKRVNCRLICLRVSPQIAQRRRRALNATARKKGRACSSQHLMLAEWILMVTNVPQTWWPVEMVRPLYSLRWQIELLFKRLKSTLAIHHSNTANINRLRCEVYGTLIVAALTQRMHATLNNNLWNSKRSELSADKFFKRFQERAFTIAQLMLKSIRNALAYLRHFVQLILPNCRKNKQKSRLSTLAFLDPGSATSPTPPNRASLA